MIDIISGFLGAGKTTLIQKILSEKPKDEVVALIENEFGDVGIDGDLVKGDGVEVREIYSGCICCTLVGHFERALSELIDKYHPMRIIIEPSGIAKLSDVLRACETSLARGDVRLGMCLVVVNALNYDMYMKNWPEFFLNQISFARTVVLSRAQNASSEVLERVFSDIARINPDANIITTPWFRIKAETIVRAAERDAASSLVHELMEELSAHHHHHEEEGRACGVHEHGHDADEVFDVWGLETPRRYAAADIEAALGALEDGRYGIVLRAKGIVQTGDGQWTQFDFVPGETALTARDADYTGRICVIGQNLNKPALAALFGQD
jgi:G3E family GTPase